MLRHVGSKKALLVGHSTGGAILQSMALRDKSKIAGLVLSGTWLRSNRYMTELFKSRLAILRVAPREYSAMFSFLAYPAEWLEANWPSFDTIIAGAPMTQAAQDVVAERIAALVAFDRSSDVGRISVPQLIQGSEDDQIVPPFLQRELATVLTRADVYVFKTGGHMFPVTRTEEVRHDAHRLGGQECADVTWIDKRSLGRPKRGSQLMSSITEFGQGILRRVRGRQRLGGMQRLLHPGCDVYGSSGAPG